MARIRSVKPEFFTSETIARLTRAERLTFIGLWTHVDDNGVCRYNEMLISAALYPLDEPIESLAHVRESLASFAREALVTVYRKDGKRWLFVNSWDEHQRIDRPSKSRKPRPSEEGVEVLTSENFTVGAILAQPSRDTRETLASDQGSGSREQGRNTCASEQDQLLIEPPTSTRSPSADPKRQWTDAQIYADEKFVAFWTTYPRRTAKRAAGRAWIAALKRGTDPDVIIKGAQAYRDNPNRPSQAQYVAHPSTWLNADRWGDELSVTKAPAAESDLWNRPWEN